MTNVTKERRMPISIKLSREEYGLIKQAADSHEETISSYSRRILVESAKNPIASEQDVMKILLGIGYDMQNLVSSNIDNTIIAVNEKGEQICRILSSR